MVRAEASFIFFLLRAIPFFPISMLSSHLRCALARCRRPVLSTRSFSTAFVLRNEATTPAPSLGEIPPPKKPIGGFRGGIIGFFIGFAIAASYSASHLLEEYKQASETLQTAVDELQRSTEKVAAHVKRIETLEKDLRTLSDSTVVKEDVSRVRAEMEKLYDGLHIEFLDLRAHVWGIHQDLQSLSQKNTPQTRI